MSGNAAAQAVGRAFREEGPAILATLARQAGGDVGLAEDALALVRRMVGRRAADRIA